MNPGTKSIVSALSVCLLPLAAPVRGQTDVVKTDGIASPLHQANLGKVVFTAASIPAESLQEKDFLNHYELKATGDLGFKAFMGNSLTNYLHRLAPDLPVAELTRDGSYQFRFSVDGVLIHELNFPPYFIPAESKNQKTVFSATMVNSANEGSPWGVIWHLFLLNGGEQALSAGKHALGVEMRPYLKVGDRQVVGELIARGDLQLTVVRRAVDAKLTAIQPIAPGSGWDVSRHPYDHARIRELNRRIAEGLYRDIRSLVVIKNGELLIEEYFNGADRSTLHDTRSVGKSFASTMMGIAIGEGHIKSEKQTLKEFYDLRQFANASAKKESVTLESLLTMSSGFDANDNDEKSPGNEENMYPTDNWVKFALDLPMDEKTAMGETWRYFTAGVVVLGDILHKSVPGGLESYADVKLFKPLGIEKHEWQYTPQKVVSTAGGLQLRALDLAKYGQLYRNRGQWRGKQIVPRNWVEKSFTRQVRRGAGDDEFYGYLFWSNVFNLNAKPEEVFYATGNGGNKIFVFKDQPLVIVVTATAFGQWYAHQQVGSMMDEYILPALSK